MAEKRWIAETLFDDLGFRMSYQMEKVLYETQTEHQHLVLFEHRFFGKMLMLDGATQITKRDEFIYQEMMSHVPLFAHGNAREVLIIGGGDCGIAEEVLKHKTVRHLTQVEIDPAVVEFAREHFPEFTKPVFADKRFASIIDDGMKYVARTERRFDVIIVNSTDPQGPGKVLFSQKFYAACKGCMQKGGVMVTQNGVPIFQPAELASSVGKIPAPVRRRRLLRRRDPDLCRRSYGDGLGERRPAAAANPSEDAGGALSPGRQLLNQILDAGGSRRRLRASALYCRGGGEGKSVATAPRRGRRPTQSPSGVKRLAAAHRHLLAIFGRAGPYSTRRRNALEHPHALA